MTDVAIRVEGLGKRYRLGGQGAQYETLREALVRAAKAPARLLRRPARRQPTEVRDSQTLWALRGVSFEVPRGQVLGIIGRNGAGKTTLLRVLTRITEPTEGRAEVHGRVASLLEVGTGFHPELTGRENVYLNGAILGMRRKEIDRKFDEIVEFSEVSRFLDTPLKHYSSGMQVRLAFSVAAHLDPDVLLVDEVLAVGDAAFQQKCLAKMEEVGKGGRTVLFVSHNMPAVLRLCERLILLDEGKVVADGDPHQVVGLYLRADGGTTAERLWQDINTAPGDEVARLHAVRVRAGERGVAEVVDRSEPVAIDVEYWNLKEGARLVPSVHLYNDEGVCLFMSANNADGDWYGRPHPAGLFKSTCWIPGNLLAEGRITVLALIGSLSPMIKHARERDAVAFQVRDALEDEDSRAGWGRAVPGVVRPALRWTMQYEPLSPSR